MNTRKSEEEVKQWHSKVAFFIPLDACTAGVQMF